MGREHAVSGSNASQRALHLGEGFTDILLADQQNNGAEPYGPPERR